MTLIQNYLFRQMLWPFLIVTIALAGLALLTQSLSSISLLVEEGRGAGLFFYITLLALPQLISLLLPIALFIAALYALHRLQSDSELIVASASGLSRWGVLSPVIRLTLIVFAAHLVITLWAQPASYREMRRSLYDASADVAASLIRPGEFVKPANDLTLYVESVEPGGQLRGLLIEDAREAGRPVVYMARSGQLRQSAATPSIVLQEGTIQRKDGSGQVSFLDFESYPFDLALFIEPQGELIYKASDRYLGELIYPDPADHWEWINRRELVAEGHSRLAIPLYDIAIVLIAVLAVLGGDYSRTGYTRRIWIATAAALTLRIVGFAAQGAAADTPALNAVQYAAPLAAIALCLYLLVLARRSRAGRAGFGMEAPA